MPLRRSLRAPLFERLSDGELWSPVEERSWVGTQGAKRGAALDRAGLRESVRREVEKILNTRCPIAGLALGDRPRTVVDYGLPDITHLFPDNQEDRARLGEQLAATVAAFEPRLRQLRVVVEPMPERRGAVRALFTGYLVADEIDEPISFPAVIYARRSEASIEHQESSDGADA